jgi:hypothetical protein
VVWAEVGSDKAMVFLMGRKNPVHGSFLPLKNNEKDVDISALFFIRGKRGAKVFLKSYK